jgi:hypothetical protein
MSFHYYDEQQEMEIGTNPSYSYRMVQNEGEFKEKSNRLSFTERLKEEIDMMRELAGITPASAHGTSQ